VEVPPAPPAASETTAIPVVAEREPERSRPAGREGGTRLGDPVVVQGERVNHVRRFLTDHNDVAIGAKRNLSWSGRCATRQALRRTGKRNQVVRRRFDAEAGDVGASASVEDINQIVPDGQTDGLCAAPCL
jgi:hypothetical protein